MCLSLLTALNVSGIKYQVKTYRLSCFWSELFWSFWENTIWKSSTLKITHFWGSTIFKSRFLKNFKKVRSKNSLIYNFLPNIWSQIHSEWWARTGTWFFFAPTFQTIFHKFWHEKNLDFQNFFSCELALVYTMLDHIKLKFHLSNPWS